MVIMVTGGAGFIGGNFLHYLHNYCSNEIKQIVCVDKLTYASNYAYIKPLVDNGFVTFIKHDIENHLMVNALKDYDITHIVNFAAETHVDQSIDNPFKFLLTNEFGTFKLLDFARTLPNLKKFIHVSTDEVYGSLSKWEWPFTEESPYQPNSPYSASKASSDHWVRAFHKTYNLPTIVTNCSNNYGPNQHNEKFIPKVIENALNDKPIPVYGDGTNIRDWLYVDDHCRALYLVLTKGVAGEKYNIGGGIEISNKEIVRIILNMLGKPESLLEYVKDRPGHDFRYSINYEKIKQELGYQPMMGLTEGLKRTIEWSKNGNKTSKT